MKTLYIITGLFMIHICVGGQEPQTIMMDNNKISIDRVKPELQYIFPVFQNGLVILKNHIEVKCQLNYNFLTDEVLYIDEKGEKMALANLDDVLQVYIGTRLFIPISKAYYEVVEKGTVSLVYKWNCNIVEIGKEGALGILTDAPSVYQINQMSFDAKTWKLDVDKEANLTVEVIPYLRIKSKCIPIKGEKDFLKAFPGKNFEIKRYVDQNHLDFKKEADLRRLTIYCNSL